MASIAVAAVVVVREKRRNKSYIRALEQASDFTGNGLIFFNESDKLMSVNAQARDFLQDIFVVLDSEVSLPALLDSLFDHAVDCDQSLLNALGRSAEKLNTIGFREVIMASRERLCLIEAQKIPDVGTNIILIDVGDIKHQEELLLRLSQYNHELDQAIQVATSGIVIAKPDEKGQNYTVSFANNAFCKIFELKDGEIIGQDLVEIFEDIHDPQALRKIKKIGIEQETGNVELCRKPSEGGEHWYDLKLTPLKDYSGRLELFVGIINETTESKIHAAESSKAQRLEALGQLAAGVAHDFNNVLSIIDGYARISARNIENKEQAIDNLEHIRTASKRGASLIKQMLTFSHHEIVDLTVVNLGEMMREQDMLLKPLLGASVNCELLVDDDEMYVECPAENITQILMNLVVNARDAMPNGGELRVENSVCAQEALPEILKKQGDDIRYASILVSDTGSGMPIEVLDRVFEPFFTTKDQGKGTGLGLSMVYGLVKQIGGHIDVRSAPDQGTEIKVFMPLTTKVPKKLSGSADELGSIRFDGYTFLVAEDEPDLLFLICEMLEDLGVNVIRASNGDEALALQDDYEGQIDLLLTDVVMPELNGPDLAEMIAALHPSIGIIFMSGYPDKGQAASVAMPKDSVFVPKPVDYGALIHVIYDKLRGQNGTKSVSHWESKDKEQNMEGVKT